MSRTIFVRRTLRSALVSFQDKDFSMPNVIRGFRSDMRELAADRETLGLVMVNFEGVTEAAKESVSTLLVVQHELQRPLVLYNVPEGLFDCVANVEGLLTIRSDAKTSTSYREACSLV